MESCGRGIFKCIANCTQCRHFAFKLGLYVKLSHVTSTCIDQTEHRELANKSIFLENLYTKSIVKEGELDSQILCIFIENRVLGYEGNEF